MKKVKLVLLIDDDAPTNFINKKIIQNSGLVEIIHVAQGGSEAISFLSGNENLNKNFLFPDIIFLDINMPAMDGWEFLAEYRKLKTIKSERVIIVILTTSLNPDDELRAREIEEVYGFKSKPLTRQTIEEIVNNEF